MSEKEAGTEPADASVGGDKLDIPVCRATSEFIDYEARADSASGTDVMSGHFSMFNNWYEINSMFEGNFLERIAPGAFKKTLREGRNSIRVLLEHGYDPQVGDKPLGKPTRMAEDSEGAGYDVDLFDTSYVRDLVPALRAGVYGSSFRFQVIKDEWNNEPARSDSNPDGIPERTIKEVRVMEFGPTVFPANPAATAGLRSTTDRYYEKMRSRNPEAYEEALRSSRASRVGRPAVTTTQVEEDQTVEVEVTETEPVEARTTEATQAEEVTAEEVVTDEVEERSNTDEPQEVEHSSATATEPTTERSKTMEGMPLTVEERTARMGAIGTRLTDIGDEFTGELPTEVQEEWDGLLAERAMHDRAVKAAESRAKVLAGLASGGATERGSDAGQKSPAFIPGRSKDDIYDLRSIRSGAKSEEDLAQRLRDNAMRSVELGRFHGSSDRSQAQADMETLLATRDDEAGSLARRVLVTGSPVYMRAWGKAIKHLSTDTLTQEERTALAIGGGATGGYAVPYQLDPSIILTNSGTVSAVRAISRVEQIVGKTWQGVTSAGITVSRSAEAAEVSDNSPTLAQPEVTPTRVTGFIPFSVEVDQDWPQMQAEMARLLADAKDQEEDVAFVTGSGTPPAASGVVSTLNASSHVLTLSINAFAAGDIYGLETALGARFRRNAQWLGDRTVYNKVRQIDTAGGAQMWERIGAGLPAQLLGYNVNEASAMDDFATATGTKLLMLGDFSNFLIVDRMGMDVELVPHLFHTANNRPSGQRGILAIWRNSSKVLVDNAFRLLKVDGA